MRTLHIFYKENLIVTNTAFSQATLILCTGVIDLWPYTIFKVAWEATQCDRKELSVGNGFLSRNLSI